MFWCFEKLLIGTFLPFPNSETLYAVIHDIYTTLYPFTYGLIYNEWKRKKRSGADILALEYISRILGHCNNPALLVSHFQASI